MKKTAILFLIMGLVALQCRQDEPVFQPFSVSATVETQPVQSLPGEDAADDPAIWIHPTDPSASLLFGTNKLGGISSYDLTGKETAFYPVGRVNNIDLSYNFPLGRDSLDIIGATNRSNNSIVLFSINPETGLLEDLPVDRISPDVVEVYGFCMYKSPLSGKTYANLVGMSGYFEQWELMPEGDSGIAALKVRTFKLDSKSEGMVCDRDSAWLYIAEEKGGIWKYGAEPGDGEERTLLEMSTRKEKHIRYDLEGLTIYYTSDGLGYLIASSQGNNSFAVYERTGHNKYLGSFVIGDDLIDGVAETDGIDVTNANLGETFPQGVFVAQDGFNTDGDIDLNQNFKLVKWEEIAKRFEPALMIDTVFIR